MNLKPYFSMDLRAQTLYPMVVLLLAFSLLFSLSLYPRTLPALPSAIEAIQPASLQEMALSFVPNRGQTHPAVQFQVNSMGGVIFFTAGEMILSLPPAKSPVASAASAPPVLVRIRFEGANPAPEIAGLDRLPGVVNYLIGDDPAQWRTNIPTYASVLYRDLYPGIDLFYEGQAGALKGTYLVAPGADPARIQLAFEGVQGLSLNDQGDLILRVASGEIRQASPYVYQELAGRQVAVPASYLLSGECQASFQVAAYDATQPLIIDPTIDFATFLGGDYEDAAMGVAVDASGNVYVTGSTWSSDFPVKNPVLPWADRTDAFITKMSANGQSLIYSTYLGGSKGDYSRGIAIDSNGNVYITGYTGSSDFPTAAATQANFGGGVTDAFITQLNAAGSALTFSTYLGGSDFEYPEAIAVCNVGQAYVTGRTTSTDFPTANPLQAAHGGGYEDVFVARLNSTSSSVVYATYLGGTADERSYGIACQSSGEAYLVGQTRSTDFPTTLNAFQTTGGGTYFDAFVTQYNSNGSAYLYSTYLGGNDDDDYAKAVVVNSAGEAYLTGSTESGYFPTTPGAYDTTHNGGWGSEDAFVTQFNADGSELLFSTYFGGTDDDWGESIALGPYNMVYIGGATWSTDLPTLDAFQLAHSGGTNDAIVVQFNPTGSQLVYASYLGGSGSDWGSEIAVDGDGRAYLVGVTESADFPTHNPFDASYGGYGDGFVVKVGPGSQVATGVIPPSGGQLTALGGEATFTFPASAFSAEVVLTYEPLSQVANLGDLLGVGRAYDLTAVYSSNGQVAQLAASASYDVVITYPSSGAAIESTLALYSWDGAAWVPEPTSQLNMATKTITASPGHLSRWAILGQTHRISLPFVVR